MVAQPADAQRAGPASDSPFACIFEGVNSDQRAMAASAASQRLTDAPSDGAQRGGAVLDALLGALPRCAAAGRWTETQRDMAQLYVLAQLAREDMRRRYAAQSVDLGFLDEVALAPLGASMPSLDEMAARIRAQGVTGDRPDSAEDIAFIYSALARQAEGARMAFARSTLIGR
jgi:hypothetical protein